MQIDRNELLDLLKNHLSISLDAERNYGDFYPTDGKEFITLNVSLNWFDDEKKDTIVICSEKITV